MLMYQQITIFMLIILQINRTKIRR